MASYLEHGGTVAGEWRVKGGKVEGKGKDGRVKREGKLRGE